jgi:hypothetical protein
MPGFAAVVVITLRMSLTAGALGAAAGMVGDALDKGAEQWLGLGSTRNIRHNQSLPEFGHETAASDFLFRSFRHSLIPRYFEFRCLWISSNRCFRYSRYSCCNLGSLGEP